MFRISLRSLYVLENLSIFELFLIMPVLFELECINVS